MIEVRGLSKSFGDVHALKDVSFHVEKGKIVGFLGANGAGKTTTMDVMCGCIGPDQGTVRIAGIDVLEQPIEAKRRLGYLPDEPPIYDDMRVEEYVTYAAKLNKVPSANVSKRVDQLLGELSLKDVKRRLVGNLSKGYRQRVALAQALVHEPDVLVLDEPTEGLDPNQIVHIRELIRQFGGQHTIILSSHILSEIQNVCDELIIIDKGHVVKQGTYDELLSSLESSQAYDVRVLRGAEELKAKLSGSDAVQSVEWETGRNDTLRVVLKSGQEAVDAVAKVVIDGGHGLREIASRNKSLEDVFFQLTQ